MNINEAFDFFKNLITDTDEKSEIRICQKFIAILSDLKNRDLTEKQFQSITEELDTLQLKANSENRKKHLKQKLSLFIKFLKDEFSLISEGYYTALGISLGLAFGTAFGSIFGMGIGISFGMIIGLIIGANMDSEAKKQNRVLKTKLN